MATRVAPFYPIIYVRGYAMTRGEIDDATSSPYMGFNLGSTKIRQSWDKKVQRHIFESPLIRLMKDYGYQDSFCDGTEQDAQLPARSVVIYRYYEQADPDLGGDRRPTLVEAARGLKELVYRVRERVCGNDAEQREQFRVHLVAHSMGGLVVRAFLQNDAISDVADRQLVDKVFTYATPHNGIEMAGINVPAFLGLWDINNFNRQKIAEYLGLPGKPGRVDSLNGAFDPQRFFCFVGTNSQDYAAAAGISRKLAGEMSDGLVSIENATVAGAPRAFAYRSHSGPHGVVNSEEGYQNLVRFLFGDVRVDGRLEVEALPLPPSVQKAKDAGSAVRASYYFEAVVVPRGAFSVRLSERRRETFSAVLRSYDELLKPENAGESAPRSPVLFSAFLDSKKITQGRTLVFNLELAVSATGYTIDSRLWKSHVEGEYLFRDTLTLRLTRTPDGFNLRHLSADERWSEGAGVLAERLRDGYLIPLASGKGFRGHLYLQVQDR